MHGLGCTDPETPFLGPRPRGLGVPQRNVSYNLPGVNAVLHAKFHHCRSNGVAAFKEHTHTHSHLNYIDACLQIFNSDLQAKEIVVCSSSALPCTRDERNHCVVTRNDPTSDRSVQSCTLG